MADKVENHKAEDVIPKHYSMALRHLHSIFRRHRRRRHFCCCWKTVQRKKVA